MVRTRRLLPAALALGVGLLGVAGTAAPAGAQGVTCEPGSGPDLSNRRPSAEEAGPQDDLRCANLAGADLSGFDLAQADLSGAILTGADLSNARLVQVDLIGADLTGADLTGAELTQADFRGARLAEVDLAGQELGQVDFNGIIAPGIVLADATLSQAELNDAVLTGADLSGARLVQADLLRADLSGADLSNADLSQAEARGANLSGANLRDADLTQADLTNADLSDADVSGAELTQADVGGADLSGIKGVLPLSDWLLYGAAGVLVLLVIGSIRTALRPERPSIYAGAFAPPATLTGFGGVPGASGAPGATAASPFGFGTSTFGTTTVGTAVPPPPPAPAAAAQAPGWAAAADPFGDAGTVTDPTAPQRRRVVPKLVFGIVGSVIAVLGLHLTIGGAIGTFVEMWNPLLAVCDGPLCVVGVDAGPLGLTLGVFVSIFGFAVRAKES